MKADASCEGHSTSYIQQIESSLGTTLNEETKSLFALAFKAGYWSGRVDKARDILETSP